MSKPNRLSVWIVRLGRMRYELCLIPPGHVPLIVVHPRSRHFYRLGIHWKQETVPLSRGERRIVFGLRVGYGARLSNLSRHILLPTQKAET